MLDDVNSSPLIYFRRAMRLERGRSGAAQPEGGLSLEGF